MSALLRFIPLQTILLWLLNMFRGITVDQWDQTLRFVLEAVREFKSSADKKAWVEQQMKAAWPSLSAGGIELLRALVVAYAQKKGIAP